MAKSTLHTIQEVRRRRKKARRAQESTRLRGAKVNVQELDYKNTALLQRLLSAQGKMFSRKRTGLTAQEQRVAARAVKRARQLAMLPFVS
jgi:small subunit ribosomal protein S18